MHAKGVIRASISKDQKVLAAAHNKALRKGRSWIESSVCTALNSRPAANATDEFI